MARTPSTMLDLHTQAPAFSLPNVNGKTVSLGDFRGQPLLVMFLCNHCPFVKHVRAKLAEIGKIFQQKGIGVVAISANDISTHPDDSPEKMKIEAAEAGYTFPYLFDETQATAKAYRAACTPDFFLFDRNHRLFYRGQLDDSRPGNSIPPSGRDLVGAAETLIAGGEAPAEQKASLGCNIKWKAGSEPDYYKA
jgi:peroxiredoxin